MFVYQKETWKQCPCRSTILPPTFLRSWLKSVQRHIFTVLYRFLDNPQIHLIYHYGFNEPQFGNTVTECGRTVTSLFFFWSLVCSVLNIQRVFIYCKYVICKKHKCFCMYVYIIYIYMCLIVFLSLSFVFYNVLCVYI
jgi:hypothetical protein